MPKHPTKQPQRPCPPSPLSPPIIENIASSINPGTPPSSSSSVNNNATAEEDGKTPPSTPEAPRVQAQDPTILGEFAVLSNKSHTAHSTITAPLLPTTTTTTTTPHQKSSSLPSSINSAASSTPYHHHRRHHKNRYPYIPSSPSSSTNATASHGTTYYPPPPNAAFTATATAAMGGEMQSPYGMLGFDHGMQGQGGFDQGGGGFDHSHVHGHGHGHGGGGGGGGGGLSGYFEGAGFTSPPRSTSPGIAQFSPQMQMPMQMPMGGGPQQHGFGGDSSGMPLGLSYYHQNQQMNNLQNQHHQMNNQMNSQHQQNQYYPNPNVNPIAYPPSHNNDTVNLSPQSNANATSNTNSPHSHISSPYAPPAPFNSPPGTPGGYQGHVPIAPSIGVGVGVSVGDGGGGGEVDNSASNDMIQQNRLLHDYSAAAAAAGGIGMVGMVGDGSGGDGGSVGSGLNSDMSSKMNEWNAQLQDDSIMAILGMLQQQQQQQQQQLHNQQQHQHQQQQQQGGYQYQHHHPLSPSPSSSGYYNYTNPSTQPSSLETSPSSISSYSTVGGYLQQHSLPPTLPPIFGTASFLGHSSRGTNNTPSSPFSTSSQNHGGGGAEAGGVHVQGHNQHTHTHNHSHNQRRYIDMSPGPPIQTTDALCGPSGSNLFVFHVPNQFSNLDVFTLFKPFGNLLSVRIMTEPSGGDYGGGGTGDGNSPSGSGSGSGSPDNARGGSEGGRSRGFGFVSYDNPVSAQMAIRVLNGFKIGRKRLKVQLKQLRVHHHGNVNMQNQNQNNQQNQNQEQQRFSSGGDGSNEWDDKNNYGSGEYNDDVCSYNQQDYTHYDSTPGVADDSEGYYDDGSVSGCGRREEFEDDCKSEDRGDVDVDIDIGRVKIGGSDDGNDSGEGKGDGEVGDASYNETPNSNANPNASEPQCSSTSKPSTSQHQDVTEEDERRVVAGKKKKR